MIRLPSLGVIPYSTKMNHNDKATVAVSCIFRLSLLSSQQVRVNAIPRALSTKETVIREPVASLNVFE